MKYVSGMLLLLLSSQLYAADRAGNYAIWGMGNKSCFSYNKSRINSDDQSFKDYLMGYLTAYNTIAEDTYNISAAQNLESILGWIDNYCEEKQVHGFEQAITEFLQKHHESRYRTPPGGIGR